MSFTTFKRLQIDFWKQFRSIDVEFGENLTVLTGANSCGKTTLLNQLARHLDFEIPELATPVKYSGVFKFFSRLVHREPVDDLKIGRLVYTNGVTAEISVPNADSPQFNPDFANRQAVSGLYLPSHRPIYSYKPISNIPTGKRKKREAFDLTYSAHRSFARSGKGESASFRLKETLIGWAIYGGGNQFIDPDQDLAEHFVGFEGVLRKILPREMKFERLLVRNHEVILQTTGTEFLLEAVSGGIAALIDIAWQLYVYPRENNIRAVVLIDEIENHLHPSMQREVLPNLIEAFPECQFVIATHSPLVVTSVQSANVYALQFDHNGMVVSRQLDLRARALTANQVLRDVLDTPATLPLWAEANLAQVLGEFRSREIDENGLRDLRQRLHAAGLDEFLPQVLSNRDRTQKP